MDLVGRLYTQMGNCDDTRDHIEPQGQCLGQAILSPDLTLQTAPNSEPAANTSSKHKVSNNNHMDCRGTDQYFFTIYSLRLPLRSLFNFQVSPSTKF